MLLFNQSKSKLEWAMNGSTFACEPWSSVEVPDELVQHCARRGLPLGSASVAPELRAREQMADERKAHAESALLALKDRAEAAEADARHLKSEFERTSTECSEARGEANRWRAETERLRAELERANSDKRTLEELLEQESKRATDAEAKAIKADAAMTEARKAKGKDARASAG